MNPLNNRIRIRANNFNIHHFNSIGYYPKMNEYIEIFVYELPVGSGTKIEVQCNYCEVIFKKAYRRYLETKEDVCCSSCKKEKMMKVSLEKYGNICSLRNPEVFEKSKKKNNETLGVDFPFQNKKILEKCRETILQKHSSRVVFSKNKISKQQIKIHSLYGGEINYNCFPYLLDIFFSEKRIYFEYDGGGHNLNVKLKRQTENEFVEKEIEREKFLFGLGYKQFRIISKTDKLPSDDILMQIKNRAFYILINENFNKYIYNIDTNTESFNT